MPICEEKVKLEYVFFLRIICPKIISLRVQFFKSKTDLNALQCQNDINTVQHLE